MDTKTGNFCEYSLTVMSSVNYKFATGQTQVSCQNIFRKTGWVKCVKSVRIRSYSDPYSVRMRGKTDQNNSEQFVETHSCRRVSGESLETLWKLHSKYEHIWDIIGRMGVGGRKGRVSKCSKRPIYDQTSCWAKHWYIIDKKSSFWLRRQVVKPSFNDAITLFVN